MPELIIDDELWNRMTEAEKTDLVRHGGATLRQLMQGLLDGPSELQDACRQFLVNTGTSLEELPLPTRDKESSEATNAPQPARKHSKSASKVKQRFGLPEGFTSRHHRFGRLVLLEENIYRLPNGQEFVPVHPTGTLGRMGHLYALLTEQQFEKRRRGSVYIRTDGRVFDYSRDVGNDRELFDTGYTIHDLQRTGRYVDKPKKAKRIRTAKKARSASRSS